MAGRMVMMVMKWNRNETEIFSRMENAVGVMTLPSSV